MIISKKDTAGIAQEGGGDAGWAVLGRGMTPERTKGEKQKKQEPLGLTFKGK